jgi:hypothetical protein
MVFEVFQMFKTAYDWKRLYYGPFKGAAFKLDVKKLVFHNLMKIPRLRTVCQTFQPRVKHRIAPLTAM